MPPSHITCPAKLGIESVKTNAHHLISYIRGFTLLRVTRDDARAVEGPANLQVTIDEFNPATFPELHAVAGYLQNNTSTERFVEGLRQLVAGFTRQI